MNSKTYAGIALLAVTLIALLAAWPEPTAAVPASSSQQMNLADEVASACGGINPYFAVTSLVYEAEDQNADDEPAVVVFRDTPTDAGADNHTVATRAQVGAVYGLAYDHTRGQLYVGAYHKRAVYFGPGGPGQVYRIDLATGAISDFVTLPAGQDMHDTLRRNLDADGADYVGKTSLGDIEIDDDATELFVANILTQRIQRYSLPDGQELPSFRLGADNEPWRGNARLFGLGWLDGWLYHGVVDSGEMTSMDHTNLAVVYRSRADGSEMAEVARADLSYSRPVPWQRWRGSLSFYQRTAIGQPMLADIEFDEQGNPVLGLRDRVTDMLAVLAVNDARYGAGDILPTRPEGAAWSVVTSPEHYEDRTVIDEALWGGLAAFPGLDHLVASALGPVDLSGAGALWLDNGDGGQWRREFVSRIAGGSTLSGSSGLGDVESMCPPDTTLDQPAVGTATAIAVTATAAAGTATAIATQTAVANEPVPLPGDFAAACGTENPYMAGVCYDAQDWFASGYDWAAIVGFRDTPMDGPTDPPQLYWLASASDVGSVWGLGFQRSEGLLYASAFHKRLVRFGPGGPGAVYSIDVVTGDTQLLVTVPNAGSVHHSATANLRDPDSEARDWAGKTSLGDIDVDEEQDELFVVNLQDRRIYRYELPSGNPLGSFEHGAAHDARSNDMRPFALKFHDGKLYHGVVDSAQRSGNPANLHGRVYESDRDGANMRLVATFPFDYARGVARIEGVITSPGLREVPLEWMPWKDDNNDHSGRLAEMSVYPQPIISDIEFNLDGDMVLGIRDRHGDMTVARQVMTGQTVLEKPGLPAGDTLLARFNGSTWDVETPDAMNEHFYDRTSLTDENTLGALARVTGFDLVLASSLLKGTANYSTTSYGLDETAVWYVGDSGARARHELICRLPQVSLSRVPSGAADRSSAQPMAAVPEPDRPQHNEYVPASNMGDIEELCGPEVPTPTPTEGPSPTVTATSTTTPSSTITPSPTVTPSATITPTPTPSVWTIYLPLAVRDRKCDPRFQHVDVVLVLDASYTMRDLTRAGRPKLEAAKDAARQFVDAMRFPGDQAAIVSFNVQAYVNSPLVEDRTRLHLALDSIVHVEYTRIDLGLDAAHQLLMGSQRRGVNTPVIILLSDGRSNPYWSRQGALDNAEAIKDDGIELYTIGLGEDADHADLRVMATTRGHYHYAPDGEDLVPIYLSLVYEIPCPPSTWWPFR